MNIANDTYQRIHFAAKVIKSGARKLGISGKEMQYRLMRKNFSVQE